MKILLSLVLSLLLLLPTAGCGTLMFQERQNQTHLGKRDPNVLIMDGLGLLVFVVPGVVAFLVDFQTHAIYLPPNVAKGEGPFITDQDALLPGLLLEKPFSFRALCSILANLLALGAEGLPIHSA